MGEVKVTEWIRSGQTAWMKNIPRTKATAYGASPTGLSKEWWRRLIHQCSAAGYMLRLIRPLTYTQSINGSYASLKPTEKGRDAISTEQLVLLPEVLDMRNKLSKEMETKDYSPTASTDVPSIRVRCGKGRYMLPVLKDLFAEKENLIEVTFCNIEHYQYPEYHSSNHSNVLYYTSDVTQLPHYSESQVTGIKHQETQMGWNVQMGWLKVKQVKFLCLLLCSHCMKKTVKVFALHAVFG